MIDLGKSIIKPNQKKISWDLLRFAQQDLRHVHSALQHVNITLKKSLMRSYKNINLGPDQVDETSCQNYIPPHTFLECFLHADFDTSREKPWTWVLKT